MWFIEIDYGARYFGPFSYAEAMEEAASFADSAEHIELHLFTASRTEVYKN